MRSIPALAAAALRAGCATMTRSGPAAVAELAPAKADTARGTATFTSGDANLTTALDVVTVVNVGTGGPTDIVGRVACAVIAKG